jgi:hypothetical protein
MIDILILRTSKNKTAAYGVIVVRKGDVVVALFRSIENLKKIFPPGKYKVKWLWSPRFSRWLYELLGIPKRAEIKFHVANYPEELDGCIGVGLSHQDIDKDGDIDLAQSRDALTAFHNAMAGTIETTVTVIESYQK